jgi:hypothetical protein
MSALACGHQKDPDHPAGAAKGQDDRSPYVVALEFYQVARFAAPKLYTVFHVGGDFTASDFMTTPIPHHGRIRMTRSDGSHGWCDDYLVKSMLRGGGGDGKVLAPFSVTPAY